MNQYINDIFQKIESLNPVHSKKIKKNIDFFDDTYYKLADAFFLTSLPLYAADNNSYLDIGAGHGLNLSKALEIFSANTKFAVVDISETSIELAKNFNNDGCVLMESSRLCSGKSLPAQLMGFMYQTVACKRGIKNLKLKHNLLDL